MRLYHLWHRGFEVSSLILGEQHPLTDWVLRWTAIWTAISLRLFFQNSLVLGDDILMVPESFESVADDSTVLLFFEGKWITSKIISSNLILQQETGKCFYDNAKLAALIIERDWEVKKAFRNKVRHQLKVDQGLTPRRREVLALFLPPIFWSGGFVRVYHLGTLQPPPARAPRCMRSWLALGRVYENISISRVSQSKEDERLHS